MRVKNIISIFVCVLIMIMSVNVVSFAEQLNSSDVIFMEDGKEEISPFSVYILNGRCNLSFSNGKANVNASVVGKSGVTKTSIVTKLQELKGGSWVNLKTSTKKTGGKTCSVLNSYSVTKGYTYRAVAIITAENESKTLISTSQKY
ncbi:hypothetical protein IR152_19030 [Clostridioides sp. ES-S-0108-01]|uniref:hypothetical protein n=1 Tax=unclassified Clostridioides TaxID=2635829 RepID=UPI001D0C9C72|nr:hypothetical protein [Clostridioides sp. ES-S-0107-01]MCC0785094.1 hypothetical protein [Clostridioides sp. ES-S-0108-01]UDN53141.1 hypothetical protein JJC16_19265 [Clostridioides sp. ES-S-0107-01]